MPADGSDPGAAGGRYAGYFREKYRYSFSADDVDAYRRWFAPQWKLIRSLVAIGPGTRVVEIGSGIGGLYSYLAEANVRHYRGLELDPDAVRFANTHFGVEHFLHCDVMRYAPEEKVDVVFAFEVLEHLENPTAALVHLRHLLQPGGVLCATTPYPYARNVAGDGTHLSVLHPLNWKRLLDRCGFSEVVLRPMSFMPLMWRLHPRLNPVIPAYLPFPGWVSTTLLIGSAGTS